MKKNIINSKASILEYDNNINQMRKLLKDKPEILEEVLSINPTTITNTEEFGNLLRIIDYTNDATSPVVDNIGTIRNIVNKEINTVSDLQGDDIVTLFNKYKGDIQQRKLDIDQNKKLAEVLKPEILDDYGNIRKEVLDLDYRFEKPLNMTDNMFKKVTKNITTDGYVEYTKVSYADRFEKLLPEGWQRVTKDGKIQFFPPKKCNR